MIREAVAHTLAEWPGVPDLGMVTFVDASKVRHKRDPGRCYLKAGSRKVGYTASGLIALQLLPTDMPDPVPAPGTQMTLLPPSLDSGHEIVQGAAERGPQGTQVPDGGVLLPRLPLGDLALARVDEGGDLPLGEPGSLT
jgi:hypothetical protein